MEEITVPHSRTKSLRVIFVVLLLSMRKKILLLSFYLLYSHENEFSLIERAEMTQNEKVTRSVSQMTLISSIPILSLTHVFHRTKKFVYSFSFVLLYHAINEYTNFLSYR